MAILGSWDVFEVALGEFRFSSHDNLQIRGHPIIFGYVFSIDLTYSSESHRTSSSTTLRVVSILRHAMTTSYSTSLLVARNPRV